MGERYMELINAEVEVAAGAGGDFAVFPIQIPTSKTEQFAFLLRYLWMHARNIGAGLGKTGDIAYGAICCLTLWEPTTQEQVLNAMKRQGTILWQDNVWLIVESALTTWTNEYTTHKEPINYDTPILIARDTIWLSACQSASNTDAVVAGCCLGYTLEKVSREAFIAALVD